jgi:hypothetical protein
MGVSVGNEETYQDANDRRRDRANLRHRCAVRGQSNGIGKNAAVCKSHAASHRSGPETVGDLQATDMFLSYDRRGSRVERHRFQRPNQVLENPHLDESKGPRSQYLNPAAFVPAALGILGNFGRVNVRAPGTWQVDAALSRIF